MTKRYAIGGAVVLVLMSAAGQFGLRRAEAAAESQVSPVAFELCTAEGALAIEKCQVLGPPPTYVVPAGRVFTIEQVSGDCSSDAAPGSPLRPAIVAQTGGAVVPHWIIGIPREAPFPGGLIPLEATRIYADTNSIVTLGLSDVPRIADRFCRVSFSGTLTKM